MAAVLQAEKGRARSGLARRTGGEEEEEEEKKSNSGG